ncbi:MAG: flagellar M-ring protein FliF [Candidatus Lindowbacteria bacterium]|nr:flagellar M-ring protein FliF [Candidatus Lindowbacteria bacterium]
MNDLLANLQRQFSEVWTKLTSSQRIWAGAIGAITLALLVSIALFANKPVWVELGNFVEEQAAEVTSELERAGYKEDQDYKVTGGGRIIEVDAKLRNKMILVLAEKGVMGSMEKGFSIFDKFNLMDTDYKQKLKTFEALKSEMRSMIRTYQQVEDVNISVPFSGERSSVLFNDVPQTASVVLTLKPGIKLKPEHIRAITNIIANGFARLNVDHVAITDQFMNPLVDEGGERNLITKQGGIVRETELGLEQSVRSLLGPVLRSDKFTVQVKVKFDWDKVQKQLTKFESPGFEQLMQSQQTEEESLKGRGLRPGGEPGTASNTPLVYNSIAEIGPIDYKRAEKIVNFLANKTSTEIVQAPYVERLTASVIIDGTCAFDIDTDGNFAMTVAGGRKRVYTPRTTEEMTILENAVYSALGNDISRNDQISVVHIRWNREQQFELEDEQYKDKLMKDKVTIYGLLATPFLIALLLLYMAWRRHIRLKEEELARQRELERQRALAAAEAGLAGEISLEDQERQEIQRRAASLARAKPQVVSDLIRTWMAEDNAA